MQDTIYGKQYPSDNHLAKWISNSPQLEGIITHIQNIILLRKQLREYLQTPLCDSCTVVTFSAITLTMSAETPALASQLRYRTYDILQFVQSQCGLSQIKNIQVQVNPQYNQEKCFSQP